MLYETPQWLATLKDWWWLVVLLFGLLATIWRLAIKINKLKEQVETVPKQQSKMDTMDEKVNAIGDKVVGIEEKLDLHVVKQDGDMAAIMTALLEILECMKSDCPTNTALKAAHKDFQKHLVKRKQT